MATEDSPPSKVLHFRNVGQDVTQSDITTVGTMFGEVSQVIMLRNKNQALLQMADLNAAIHLHQFYQNAGGFVLLKGKRVYVKFSRHQSLTNQGPPANRVLLATLHNPLYDVSSFIPLSCDLLHQVFSPHGMVEKIVIITKNTGGGTQSLIQYDNVQSATNATAYLQGQNVYIGNSPDLYFSLDIQYSNLPELKVHRNTRETRDFTNPLLPTQVPMNTANMPMGYQQYLLQQQLQHQQMHQLHVPPPQLQKDKGTYGQKDKT